ncbi:MAG: hypothetical protein HRU18_23530 [Pseudoalteromonas sp.]|uniref:hypothetical protein n=1 Tax=Pseudoalteromonas sp. TaxID=53249 RepID=UPI001D923926|nr:hypothetical protein [Pseudoalteromonas sp.]NRA81182.1 hypothetical protein [Pseudoalteromonas sp.]
MSISEFVFNSIVTESKKAGATDMSAKKHAAMGQKMFDRSSFIDKTAGKMIERMAKEAGKELKPAKNKK